MRLRTSQSIVRIPESQAIDIILRLRYAREAYVPPPSVAKKRDAAEKKRNPAKAAAKRATRSPAKKKIDPKQLLAMLLQIQEDEEKNGN